LGTDAGAVTGFTFFNSGGRLVGSAARSWAMQIAFGIKSVGGEDGTGVERGVGVF